MDNRYQTLQLLAELSQEAAQPTLYQFIPRELILRSTNDWATIYTHLAALEKEELVIISQAEGVKFCITQKGIDHAALLASDSHKIILKK